ncbi:unnamed protein product [Lupinus luteus]|uniref:beta-ketoacyl-[acyl-carrier-protein] synthase I n=1 Tax=Lupinus luteus TaxID=3873 RepID=A0AAV1YBB9_LUPLU
MSSSFSTWLMDSCMSITCDSDHNGCLHHHLSFSSSSSKRRSRFTNFASSATSKFNTPFISSLYGSGIHGFITSLQPCSDYYASNTLSNPFPFNTLNFNRKQRRLNSLSHSGKTSALQPDQEVTSTKKPHTKQRRVVVTGLGVVTPLGHDPDVFYNNLLNGVSGISEIESFDCADFPTRIAGEIKSFSTEGWVAPKLSKKMDKFMLYMLIAGKKALIDGGITKDVMDELNKEKCGVLIGSGMGGMKVISDSIEALRVSYRKLTPFSVPFATPNMGSAVLAIDLDGDGFVMGEGAGVLLLEELEHAKKRGANIYAEFLGGSFTSDAYHVTEPHPDGAGVLLCIEKALADSGISKEDVNYINAHATSSPAGDLKEYQALTHCFGRNPELRVNSTKSMIGHLLGAAGAVEAVATIKAIKTGWIHPNINLENPDKGVDAKVFVGPTKERLDIKAALSNSSGFGGHNSSIIFAPYK